MKRHILLVILLLGMLSGCCYQLPQGTEIGIMSSESMCTTEETTTEDTIQTQPSTNTTESTGETVAQEKLLVVIDAGHQRKGNYDKEPLGPGSEKMKAKVSSGTKGKYTGLWEYELNLTVSFLLQEILLDRGYDVVMIRTSHDVDISNAERAAIANSLEADIFIRIHANGSDNREINGIMTLCQTQENPYNSHLYSRSRLLAELVLEQMIYTTGANRRYVWETDTMTGINWCQVPVTIVEMGYMSNEKEDRLLATAEYQQKLAEGIANGIDQYFEAMKEQASG